MANRRMFSKTITNSSDFLMMSLSAQALYFHIGMNADDDGFCEIFTIMRMTESKPDDLKMLHAKGLIYVINDKVCIVKDWHKNNLIRKDRYERSRYFEDSNIKDIYLTIMKEKIKNLEIYDKKGEKDEPLPLPVSLVNQRLPQDRLGKVRLGKDNIYIPLETQIEPFKNQYSERMITDFILYWKETNEKGKEKWQLEKTWNIDLRLKRWKRQQEQWDYEKSQRNQRIVEDKPKERRTGIDSGFVNPFNN
jgi:hypothetical protein